jgi:GT2 family glycosyltransferase
MYHSKPNVVIVIPTYWTWGSARADGPVQTVYDHPTPLNGESTLPRLLESLTALRGPEFSVLILTAATHPELEQAVAGRVAGLIAPFRADYPIAQATEADAVFIRHRHPGLAGHVQMCGYAGVRNLQLLLPHALGAEVIVALDDDEVVAPDYLQTALHFVGREHEGERVLGLAGFYLDAGGDVMQPERSRTGNIFMDKSAIMNEGTRALQAAPGRLVPTPVAFGGNTVFHRDLFTRVGFDPGITRGEDIDHLINAHLLGFKFWLDKQLVITHLPPDAPDSSHSAPTFSKLHQDVLRFVYEREKLRLAGVAPALFDPYPGRFLRDDVEEQALGALRAQATPEATARFGPPETIVAQARRHAIESAPRYLEFAQAWPRLIEAVGRDAELRERLLVRFDQSASVDTKLL